MEEKKKMSLTKKIVIGVIIAIVVLIIIDAMTPKYKTVCYEYDKDGASSEQGSEATNEDENEYSDFDEDSEVVCHYANTSHYNSFFWHTTYISGGNTYNQGTEVSPSNTSKYDNVNDLESVESSSNVQKEGDSKSASDTSKSSSKGSSTGKSSSQSSGGKSSSSSSGGRSSGS